MRLLLDTHVLLWCLGFSSRRYAKTRALIERSETWVSAASIWEISIKASLGKLKADPEAILASVEPAGFSLLPVTAEHAVRVFSLGLSHGDPFDRLLATQAQLEGMTLLTRDEALLACGPWVSLAD
jgi:PIN domain nuclease of toxin-antitoxin system